MEVTGSPNSSPSVKHVVDARLGVVDAAGMLGVRRCIAAQQVQVLVVPATCRDV